MRHRGILVIDYGSQYNELVARRVRQAGVYSEICSYQQAERELASGLVEGIILTGGPLSVYQEGAFPLPDCILASGLPVLGICYGFQLLSHYLGGKVDYYLMRFVDIMYGLPYMLLVIICMAIFGRQIVNLFFALALVSWLTIARMVRGQIMSLKNQEYVEAARSMGAGTMHIIFKHMIPNSLSIIIVYSTIRIPAFIMQESFLSFLGLGVQAPYASWGSLIGDAVSSMALYPYKLIIPSIVMVIFLFSMNFLGDGLRDAFDPQTKNQL